MEDKQFAFFEKINTMLMEMASGNFHYRLARGENHGEQEAMVLLLNMLAEEIQESLKHQGYANLKGSIIHIIQMNFLLDHQGRVLMVNEPSCTILGYPKRKMIGKPFETFLHSSSHQQWIGYFDNLEGNKSLEAPLGLTFSTSKGLLVPNICHITRFTGHTDRHPKILVIVIQQIKQVRNREERFKREMALIPSAHEIRFNPKPRLSHEDIRKITEGRNYILSNLEDDLPSLKEFAHQLGTNEFKLKYGFRELFGISVFRFLLQERLRKAKMLIQYTDYSIKTVAFKTGFKSIPHFSRSFKKIYGFSPSVFRKHRSYNP